MTFNIVIANPPYDRKDTQMKFASLAHDLCTQYSMIIMPAKWQCKGDKTKENISYSDFRAVVVPHIRKMCYYPQCADVFDIFEPSGITYYIADKHNKFSVKTIENRCNSNKYYNDVREREFAVEGIAQNSKFLCKHSINNKGQQIIDKLGDFKPYLVSEYTDNKQYQYWINGVVPGGIIFNAEGTNPIIGVGEVISKDDTEIESQLHPSYFPLFTSDNILEIISFLSYAYTKFVRFLIFNSICGMSVVTNDTWWRFVPDQTFDHIFTDAELYEKYKLSKEDIAVIEGTIAERPLKTVLSWLPQQYITQALEELNNKI